MSTQPTTRHLMRRILSCSLAQQGYVASGNLAFRLADWPAIERGCWRYSVTEKPRLHAPRVVRAACLLEQTYTDASS